MTTRNDKLEQQPLTAAAAAFEQALETYEKLSLELERTPVRSEKTLSRARKLLQEASDSESELGRLLMGLSQAMNGARDRQQGCMDRVNKATTGAQQRAEEFRSLLERVTALGDKAKDVNEPVSKVLSAKINGGDPEAILASLEDVNTRLSDVVTDAEAVLEAADTGDWPEIARDVKSLKQQIQSVRAKVQSAVAEAAIREQVRIQS
jgi:hypothetical protein